MLIPPVKLLVRVGPQDQEALPGLGQPHAVVHDAAHGLQDARVHVQQRDCCRRPN